MRMSFIGLPVQARLVWNRITFSRLTIAYFAFSLLHFIVQISFQLRAFTVNAGAASFIADIVKQGGAINGSFPIFDGDTLRMCSWVPANLDVDVASCPVVWDGTSRGTNWIGDTAPQYGSNDAAVPALSGPSATANAKPLTSTRSSLLVSTTSRTATTTTVFVVAIPTSTPVIPPTHLSEDYADDFDAGFDSHSEAEEDKRDEREGSRQDQSRDLSTYTLKTFVDAGEVKVNISGMGYGDDTPATLDSLCVNSLNYPLSTLNNTIREDMVFIAFQVWVLGMSLVALWNESIPHILASLLTHMLATGWAGFQIERTADFQSTFHRVIAHGACDGIRLLPDYWHARSAAEIPILAFNAFTLVVSFFLTWKLIKLYGWQTFKRVGASRQINRIYKLVLTISILIQLSVFFIVVTVSLWLDQLLNSVIGDLALLQKIYKASSIMTLILIVPWSLAGWFGVRRELRAPMFVFLLLSALYLAGWGVMFFSITFRWTFITWRFFSVMASASVFLTLTSFILGIVCRFNFGKGLLRYLNAHEELVEEPYNNNYSDDIEKVDFPSTEKPIPTFSAAFGTGPEVPPPSQMFPSNVGPRFYRSGAPFDNQSRGRSVSPVSPPRSSSISPPTAVAVPPGYRLGRNPSDGSSYSGTSVARSNTNGSQYSVEREHSYYSYGRSGGSDGGHSTTTQKRWVIE